VRSETHKLQYCDIGLDVTIAVVFPVANQRMVVVLFGQRLIICKRGENVDEIHFQRCPVRSFRFVRA